METQNYFLYFQLITFYAVYQIVYSVKAEKEISKHITRTTYIIFN